MSIDVRIDPDFWSWFAGFWEGEGCATAYKDPNGRLSEFRFHVCQADRSPMEYIRRQTNLGTVHFNRPVKRAGWNDGGNWYWSLHNRRDIIAVVNKLLPYLRFKQKQLSDFLAIVKEADEKDDAHHFWTRSELELLRLKYTMLSRDELEVLFSVPWRTIQSKARKLGLKRPWGK